MSSLTVSSLLDLRVEELPLEDLEEEPEERGDVEDEEVPTAAEDAEESREESRGLRGRREAGRGRPGRRDRVEDRGGEDPLAGSRARAGVDVEEEGDVERVVDVVSPLSSHASISSTDDGLQEETVEDPGTEHLQEREHLHLPPLLRPLLPHPRARANGK